MESIVKKCNKSDCENKVSDELYGYRIACGYRNKASNFYTAYCCSTSCLEYCKKYKWCTKCFEPDNVIYVEELGYSLCKSRGDFDPSCFSVYKAEIDFRHNIDSAMYKKTCEIIIEDLSENCSEIAELVGLVDKKVLSYNNLLSLYKISVLSKIEEKFEDYFNMMKSKVQFGFN